MMMRFDGSVPFFEESCVQVSSFARKKSFFSLSLFLRASIKKLVVFQFLSSERYSPFSYPLEILS
jgi:hypothetical protein